MIRAVLSINTFGGCSARFWRMNRFLLPAITAMSFVCMTGCVSTGLSVRETQNDYGLYVDSLCQRADLAAAAPVRPPIRLAVAQIGETAPPAAFTEGLSRSDLIRQTIPIPMPGAAVPGNWARNGRNSMPSVNDRLKDAQNLAREMGADYLLIVGGNVDTRTAHNPLAILDFTIVGGAVAPGVNVHAEGKAAGALLDVVSGRVVFLTNAEAKDSGVCPAFYQDDKCDQMEVKMRDVLLKKLASAFLEKLRQQSLRGT